MLDLDVVAIAQACAFYSPKTESLSAMGCIANYAGLYDDMRC
jgi:hypothetical protein